MVKKKDIQSGTKGFDFHNNEDAAQVCCGEEIAELKSYSVLNLH